MPRTVLVLSILSFACLAEVTAPSPGKVSGELRKWHKVTISFNGPNTSETAKPNPFTDYRLDVTFTNGDAKYVVPGYYAADGNAANTGAAKGNIWLVHFAPDKTGTWTYKASFTTGANVAQNGGGKSAGFFDGANGTFDIEETNKTGRDLRGKGRLQYVGKRYLRFAEKGEYFLKQGADAPENFLAYHDFDGDFKKDGVKDKFVKTWKAHIRDWKPGDPVWQKTKGKGIIGAINYLASEGMNVFSFLPMNIEGDDRNVFPYLNYKERLRMDCSKLAQWAIVLDHATSKGMFLHFKTQETENELLLDKGNLGLQRKLYYRELIARFSHNLALNWNLGEEINNATTEQKKAWAKYFWQTDPYKNHIVIHNMGNPHYDLLGKGSKLTGFSLQTSKPNFAHVHKRVRNYLDRSKKAGKIWAVACDEPGDASHSLRPDKDAGNSHEDGRKNGLWGTLMAGGWGNEWYFGYKHAHSDLTCQDFRSRDKWWDYCRYALEFFKNNRVPFWEMDYSPNSVGPNAWCLTKAGEVYVVHLRAGGTTELDLKSAKGKYQVQWYDPRNGGELKNGSVQQIKAGDSRGLGNAPDNPKKDWVILVTKIQEVHSM